MRSLLINTPKLEVDIGRWQPGAEQNACIKVFLCC